MRLIHFAFALTLILLGITGYLAWEGQQEARGARAELALLAQQQQAQAAATGNVPAPGSFAPVAPAPVQPLPPGAVVTPSPTAPPPANFAMETGAPAAVAARTRTLTPAGVVSTPAAPATTGTVKPAAPPAQLNTEPAPPPLTPLQRQVLSMPAIAKVESYVKEHGFVALDSGSKQQIAAGMKFNIRRGNAVIGLITVSGVEESEAIADLDPRSVPPGVTIEAGDEVIQVVHP